MRTFLGNQDATCEMKSEVIFIILWYFLNTIPNSMPVRIIWHFGKKIQFPNYDCDEPRIRKNTKLDSETMSGRYGFFRIFQAAQKDT